LLTEELDDLIFDDDSVNSKFKFMFFLDRPDMEAWQTANAVFRRLMLITDQSGKK